MLIIEKRLFHFYMQLEAQIELRSEELSLTVLKHNKTSLNPESDPTRVSQNTLQHGKSAN